jgi:hypothetical protein
MKMKKPKKFGARAPSLKLNPFKPIKPIKEPKASGGSGRKRKSPF